ncbi:hypothetical protein Bca4012_036796 [Brassica carinata]
MFSDQRDVKEERYGIASLVMQTSAEEDVEELAMEVSGTITSGVEEVKDDDEDDLDDVYKVINKMRI